MTRFEEIRKASLEAAKAVRKAQAERLEKAAQGEIEFIEIIAKEREEALKQNKKPYCRSHNCNFVIADQTETDYIDTRGIRHMKIHCDIPK